jgi:hypothetical protein
MTLDKQIKEYINKPFGGKGEEVCWNFCQLLLKMTGKEYKQLSDMKEIKTPIKYGVVLYKSGALWHCGFIWPDGLHFLHTVQEDQIYMVRRERTTAFPWNCTGVAFYE